MLSLRGNTVLSMSDYESDYETMSHSMSERQLHGVLGSVHYEQERDTLGSLGRGGSSWGKTMPLDVS